MSNWKSKTAIEKVAAIKAAWFHGASAAKIAAIAGATSRQAVIGLYHRHKSELIDFPLGAPRRKTNENFSSKKTVNDKTVEIVDPVQKGQTISIHDKDRIATGITMMQFTKNTCKWCVSDDDFIFCGEWTDQLPYCEHHRERSKTIGTLSERMTDEKHLEKYISR